MTTTQERPAEELTASKRHPRRKVLGWITAVTGLAAAGGVFLSKNNSGRRATTDPKPGGVGGAGGGESTQNGVPKNLGEIADNPAFRQLVARVLDAPESSITSRSNKVLVEDREEGDTLSVFGPDNSVRLSISYRPRISRPFSKEVDSLELYENAAENNPNYTPVTITGAEKAFYNKGLGSTDVFGTKEDNFMMGVQLSSRDASVPIDKGGNIIVPSGGAEVATRDIAQLIVREYFGS